MVDIIFSENFSIIQSLLFIISITSSVYFLKYFLFIRKLNLFYKIPSVIIFGEQPKTSRPLISKFSDKKIFSHHENSDIKIVVSKSKGKKMQFVQAPYSRIYGRNSLNRLKKTNYKSFIFLLSGSSLSESIEDQIKRLEKLKKNFNERPTFLIVNNLNGKIGSLNKKYDYKIFENKDENINKLKKIIFSFS